MIVDCAYITKERGRDHDDCMCVCVCVAMRYYLFGKLVRIDLVGLKDMFQRLDR